MSNFFSVFEFNSVLLVLSVAPSDYSKYLINILMKSMIYVYGVCERNALSEKREYITRFPNERTLDNKSFLELCVK